MKELVLKRVQPGDNWKDENVDEIHSSDRSSRKAGAAEHQCCDVFPDEW